jgi:cytochrome P450
MVRGLNDLPTIRLPDDAATSGELPDRLARFAAERGPIFQLDNTSEPLVYLIGPEANRFVLHTHREHFSHARGWTPVLGDWFGQGLLNMDPPEHTEHRRLMNPAFTGAFMAAYLPIMRRVVADRTRSWAESGDVELTTETREVAFDVAAAALTGVSVGPLADRLRELFYGLLHGFDPSQETWEEFERRQNDMVGELDGILLPLIAARRAKVAASPRDVLGLLVAARDDLGHPLSDTQILAHLKILLVAGHETTTTLAAWTLYLLATHPDHRAKVEAELAGALPGPVESLTPEALRGTRFLDAFLKEVGRLYSPVIQVPRGVVGDFEFAGYLVPSGTRVRLGLAAGHRLPTIWAQPEAFDPSRFEPPREEDKAHPYALVTFGGGPRVCIGMSFAQFEVKALVAHVLRRYRLEPSSDQPPIHAGYWTAFAPVGVHARVFRR